MKITPARARLAGQPTGRFSRAVMQREMARQAAKDKELARYIPLECGHLTARETQERYSIWRRRGMAMCETCADKGNGWVKIKPPPIREPYPDEPMF